ncbi:MAG TPA: hypothetical protein VFO73_05730 [Candidatus Limnocylindrales bacterium]|nr:hypothetical protein [Candidatus Limnocylindrales bacterium]
MSRFVLAAAFVAAITLAACGSASIVPPPSASPGPANPSAEPSTPATPPPSVTPPASPEPSVTPPPARPSPVLGDFTAGERYLYDGVRRGAVDCEPAAGSDEVPAKAIAGLECWSDDPAVARVGFYLFENDADMLAAYTARMTAEGIALDSGSCRDGEGEMSYAPGEGPTADRNGCFINDEGYANYRLTMAGSHVYVGILGRSADMAALEDFAWLGSVDTPGAPTLWSQPE